MAYGLIKFYNGQDHKKRQERIIYIYKEREKAK